MTNFNGGYPPTKPIPGPTAYTTDGKPIQTEIHPPKSSGLGANFSGLIGNNVTVPAVTIGDQAVITETANKKKRKAKKADDGAIVVSTGNDINTTDSSATNSREIVENTVYADTYSDTNTMAMGIIGQTDELLRECKQELDMIRAQRNLKGRYHYLNATVQTMGTLLSTKLQAVKEINSTIKTINDNEYRRFKDMRAMEQGDDNKAIMDAYSAFISAPVGAPEYHLPGTAALTGGLNGIVPAQYPPEVQKNMDAGMANYLAHLTPEQNAMLLDNNKDIEEVIVYDQATGAKQFQWMNTKTGQIIDNMPASSNLTIQDYSIDPRLGIAKNINLNDIKKVVVLNKGEFDKF